MIWRKDLHHPGLTALRDAAGELSAAEDWLDLPENAWLPDPEASLLPNRGRRGFR
jgi:hypothetical protein